MPLILVVLEVKEEPIVPCKRRSLLIHPEITVLNGIRFSCEGPHPGNSPLQAHKLAGLQCQQPGNVCLPTSEPIGNEVLAVYLA